MRQLESRFRYGRPRGTGDQDAPFRLPPGHRGRLTGVPAHPQARPGTGKDTTRLNECHGQPPTARADQSRAGGGKAPFVGVPPVQPRGQGRNARGQDEGDGELAGKPAHGAG